MKYCKLCAVELKREQFPDSWTYKRAKYCSRSCYLKAHEQKTIERVCPNCSTVFVVPKSSRQKICTQSCAYKGNRRTGTKYVTTQGYVAVKTHGPNSDANGYELEHRMLLQQHLGRKLETHEQVHHINGNKQDNRVENLKLYTNAEHQRLHYSSERLNTPEAIKQRVKTRWGY